MVDPSEIRERMEVIGSDGQSVGRVDKVEGNRIKLTNSDPAAQGQNQYITLDSVDSVEGNAIHLRQTAQEAKRQWQGGSGATGGAAGGGKRQ
jgi:hypothetical protein